MNVLEVIPDDAQVVLAAEVIVGAEEARLEFAQAVAGIDEAHATLSETETANLQATRPIKINGNADSGLHREFR